MSLDIFDWRTRLQQPTRQVIAWALDNPSRKLMVSNETGKVQVYAWERGHTARILPPAAKQGYTFLSPDGETIYYVQDENDSEVGVLMRMAWAGGDPEPAAPTLPPMYFYGLQVGRDGTLYFAGAGQGSFRIYRLDANGPRILYEHRNEAYLPTLSADERLLAFCASEPANNRHWQATVVDARTGERVAHLSDGDEYAVNPGRFLMTASDLAAWAPRPGDYRLLITSNRTGEPKPGVWDVTTGARQDLTPDLPGEVTPIGWRPDGERVVAQQAHEGRIWLYEVNLATGRRERLPHNPGTLQTLPPLPDGSVWYNYTSLTEPTQTRALVNGQETVVLAPSLAGTGQRWEAVQYRTSDGTIIHGFLGIPAGDGPFPTILNVHGGPTMHITDMYVGTWQSLVAEGYLFLTINFRGSTGYGRAFQEAINGQPGRLELEDMAAGRDYLIQRGLARPDRIMLYGGSYGGYLTLMGLTRQPELWRAGFAIVPNCNFELMYEDANQRLKGWARMLLGGTPDERPGHYFACSPAAQVERVQAPLYIIAHKSDTRCPIRQVEDFLTRLDQSGKPYQAEILEGGHSISNISQVVHYHERLLAFAAEHLRDGQ